MQLQSRIAFQRAKVGCVPRQLQNETYANPKTKERTRTNYTRVLFAILKKMDAKGRQVVIGTKMRMYQKQALEAFMKTGKGRCAAPDAHATIALCDAEHTPGQQQQGHDIMRCAALGKFYGYYAKVGLQNLTFYTRIQRNLDDALRDHIILTRVIEHVRGNDPGINFPTKVKRAVQQVLDEEGVAEDTFLQRYTVNVCAHHWVGRNLCVPCDRLDKALEAWQRFETAKRFQLFRGGVPAATYTPQRADAQWKQIRDAFITLRPNGGKLPQRKTEAYSHSWRRVTEQQLQKQKSDGNTGGMDRPQQLELMYRADSSSEQIECSITGSAL